MSKDWIRQRKKDHYYKKAKAQGYRSRAAFKLKEINERVRIIKPGYRVLDLGASPGGWSQVAQEIAGETGLVVAVDVVSMPSIEGVRFVTGDIEQDSTLDTNHVLLTVVVTFGAHFDAARLTLKIVKGIDQFIVL